MDRPSGSKRVRAGILVHGGAWAIPDGEVDPHLKGVHRASMVGFEVLLSGGTALEAVLRSVQYMEADEAFNAGTGSVLNKDGEVELDAAVMDGAELQSGAVACLSGVPHPVRVALEVMKHSPHAMLVGDGALAFAKERGIKTCPPEDLVLARELTRLRDKRRAQPGDTVGAVACDQKGHLAAATSTGGSLGKLPGRVGDSPLVGSGLYADDRRGAASSTGDGEAILRVVLAHRAVEAMASGVAVANAAEEVIRMLQSRTNGRGGIILVDPNGELGYAFNTPRMAHAYISEGMTEPIVDV